MLALFTIIHPLIDACSVSVLVAGGITLERVIVYNALAFALQLPLGVLMDEWPRLNRGGFFIGTGLAFAAAVLAACGAGGWSVLAAACAGNALFHLTAGKHILETHDGRGGPIGLFISTGALGLIAGQLWAAKAATACLAVFAAVLGLCIVLAAARSRGNAVFSSSPAVLEPPAPVMASKTGAFMPGLVLAGLFLLIAWRSWAGLFAGGRSAGGGAAMMLLGAAVVFAGKVAGGYLAERAGCWKVTAFSVAGSAALAFLCEPARAAFSSRSWRPAPSCRLCTAMWHGAVERRSDSTASGFSRGALHERVAVFRGMGVDQHSAGVHGLGAGEAAALVLGGRRRQSGHASGVRVCAGAVGAVASGHPRLRGRHRAFRGYAADADVRLRGMASSAQGVVSHELGKLFDGGFYCVTDSCGCASDRCFINERNGKGSGIRTLYDWDKTATVDRLGDLK